MSENYKDHNEAPHPALRVFLYAVGMVAFLFLAMVAGAIGESLLGPVGGVLGVFGAAAVAARYVIVVYGDRLP